MFLELVLETTAASAIACLLTSFLHSKRFDRPPSRMEKWEPWEPFIPISCSTLKTYPYEVHPKCPKCDSPVEDGGQQPYCEEGDHFHYQCRENGKYFGCGFEWAMKPRDSTGSSEPFHERKCYFCNLPTNSLYVCLDDGKVSHRFCIDSHVSSILYEIERVGGNFTIANVTLADGMLRCSICGSKYSPVQDASLKEVNRKAMDFYWKHASCNL